MIFYPVLINKPSGSINAPTGKGLLKDQLDVQNTTGKYQPAHISITTKGNCDTLSASAEAGGISEAWIIGYQHDYGNDGNFIADDALLIKQNGSWKMKRVAACRPPSLFSCFSCLFRLGSGQFLCGNLDQVFKPFPVLKFFFDQKT